MPTSIGQKLTGPLGSRRNKIQHLELTGLENSTNVQKKKKYTLKCFQCLQKAEPPRHQRLEPKLQWQVPQVHLETSVWNALFSRTLSKVLCVGLEIHVAVPSGFSKEIKYYEDILL